MITQLKTNWAKFYFRSVCIKLVALRINLHQEVALSLKKVVDPWCIVSDISRTLLPFCSANIYSLRITVFLHALNIYGTRTTLKSSLTCIQTSACHVGLTGLFKPVLYAGCGLLVTFRIWASGHIYNFWEEKLRSNLEKIPKHKFVPVRRNCVYLRWFNVC